MKLQKPKKWEALLEIIAVFLALVCANLWIQTHFFRVDLTEEGRYTLTEATKTVLTELEQPVYVEVYLAGELDASFERLRRSVEETLDEFKVYAGENINYSFVDIEQLEEAQQRESIIQQLQKLGIPPTTLVETVQGKRVQRVVFPGAVVSVGGKERGVLLLKGEAGSSPQEQLNSSMENLEYEFISSVQALTRKNKPSVAILKNKESLRPEEMLEFIEAASEQYIVEFVTPQDLLARKFDVLLLAQPKEKFQDLERYAVDQHVMHGGSTIFMLDKIQMTLDSIAKGGTYAFAYDLAVDDLLFRYGVRLNDNLIQDQQSGNIMVNVGKYGNRANLQAFPWPYHLIVNRFNDQHPTTRNLSPQYLRFASTLDTVKATGVRKTPLLFTSRYSRIKRCPTLVDLNELQQELDPKKYQKSYFPVAYLLEGKFNSYYAARFPPEGADRSQYRKESSETKVVVISDGDFLRQERDPKRGQFMPLGYDPTTGQQFGNKDFMMNLLAYLTEEGGVIASRKKVLKLRPLDAFRVQEERQMWQFLNLGGPVLFLLAVGLGLFAWRKRRFGK